MIQVKKMIKRNKINEIKWNKIEIVWTIQQFFPSFEYYFWEI